MTTSTGGIARRAALGALVLGGVGFLFGFLGPIALSPDANQGPLLGIFITGPGGAVLGLLVGVVTGALGVSPSTFKTVLASVGTALALTTLFFSTPEPQYCAGILDAMIKECSPPSSRRDKAIAYWEEALTRTNHYFTPRVTWKQELDRMLATEPAVVLKLHVFRRSGLFENRKPWNRGRLEARPWKEKDREQSVFATYAGGSCEAYPTGTVAKFLAKGETSKQWPPEILANLLDLQTVEPLPEHYRQLLRN